MVEQSRDGLSPAPSLEPQLQSLTARSQEALLAQLQHSLDRLQLVLLPLPGIDGGRLLWFHGNEYEIVNSVWETEGVSEVLKRWGSDRTFRSGTQLEDFKVPEGIGAKNPLVFYVSDFSYNTSSESMQDTGFRARNFFLSDTQKRDVLDTLRVAGLLDKVIPQVDSETGAELRGAQIVDVSWRVESFPSPACAGGHRTYAILNLRFETVKNRQEEVVSLHICQDGSVFRKLFAPQMAESGYEGHGCESFTLSSEELSAFLSVMNTIEIERSESGAPFQIGVWLRLT